MENMKELCIRRDRKYCNVIQQEISLFKQRFPLFFGSTLRQPTECTLDYNAPENAGRTQKKIKYYESFMFLAKFERRCISRVCANKLSSPRFQFLSKPRLRLITNSWEIVEDGGGLCHFPPTQPTSAAFKMSKRKEMFAFRTRQTRALRHGNLSSILWNRCFVFVMRSDRELYCMKKQELRVKQIKFTWFSET